MEISRTVTNYEVKSSLFSKISVCEEGSDSNSTALRAVQDDHQNDSTDQKAKVLHDQTKGLSSCLKGIAHIFQLIFHCQDGNGDDEKDPLLEDPRPQGQVEVENGSTAEGRGGSQSVTASVFRRTKRPISPGPHQGSEPQHNELPTS